VAEAEETSRENLAGTIDPNSLPGVGSSEKERRLTVAPREKGISPGSGKDYNIFREGAKRYFFPTDMKRYETFDHTADVGIRVFGRTIEEVFINAAWALFDLLTDPDSIQETLIREITVEGADREDLLVRWLSELLFLCEGEGFLFREFSISSLTATSLKAVARGEIFDSSRHRFKTEIKAVTYHQVEVIHKGETWVGKVIFDI